MGTCELECLMKRECPYSGLHTWKTMPEEMMGVIPSSISVPRLLASIIRSQYRGSEVSDDTIPYRGIWLMTRKIRRVN